MKTKRTSYRTWPVKKLAQKKCARNSFRLITPKGRPDVRIALCCPPGKQSANGRCKVSMKPHLEYKKCGFKRHGKCPRR